jgi:hypothetical protein
MYKLFLTIFLCEFVQIKDINGNSCVIKKNTEIVSNNRIFVGKLLYLPCNFQSKNDKLFTSKNWGSPLIKFRRVSYSP